VRRRALLQAPAGRCSRARCAKSPAAEHRVQVNRPRACQAQQVQPLHRRPPAHLPHREPVDAAGRRLSKQQLLCFLPVPLGQRALGESFFKAMTPPPSLGGRRDRTESSAGTARRTWNLEGSGPSAMQANGRPGGTEALEPALRFEHGTGAPGEVASRGRPKAGTRW
jgi:hypothetical protein